MNVDMNEEAKELKVEVAKEEGRLLENYSPNRLEMRNSIQSEANKEQKEEDALSKEPNHEEVMANVKHEVIQIEKF